MPMSYLQKQAVSSKLFLVLDNMLFLKIKIGKIHILSFHLLFCLIQYVRSFDPAICENSWFDASMTRGEYSAVHGVVNKGIHVSIVKAQN